MAYAEATEYEGIVAKEQTILELSIKTIELIVSQRRELNDRFDRTPKTEAEKLSGVPEISNVLDEIISNLELALKKIGSTTDFLRNQVYNKIM